MIYKEPLCFLAGAAVGAVVTYFVTKQKRDKDSNDAWEESRHYYNEKLGDMSRKNRNKPDPGDLLKTILPDDVVTEVKDPERKDYTKYNTITKEEPEDPVIADEPEIDIFPITEENWMYDRDYEKVTAIIYSDGIIAKDDDDDILEVDETVGPDGYDAGLHNSDPDRAVYIRNESRSTDYEIITSDRSYQEATGIFMGGEARD